MTYNKKLPKIALGAWAWGNDNTFGGELNIDELRPIYDEALDLGLNLWDTAFAYGMGTSEKVLGEFLKTTPKDDYIISTKFTPQCANPQAENAVTAMLENSMNLLNTDFIDIFWIHNTVDAPKWTEKLALTAKEYNIGMLGVSNHDLEEIKEANEILECHGMGYSTSEFVQALQVREERNELIKKDKKNDEDGKKRGSSKVGSQGDIPIIDGGRPEGN